MPTSFPPLLPIAELTPDSAQRSGGKGSRLFWLHEHGLPIPNTWILSSHAFEAAVESHLPKQHHPRFLLAEVGHPQALSRMGQAREKLLASPLEPSLEHALENLWTQVENHAPWGLAVRSSATCEDSESTAMAGLASSILGVRGTQPLIQAVRQVWASAFLPRTLHHLAARGIHHLSMAVVIQTVVQADASGVMFTRPPQGFDQRNWNPNERLVNATFGLGSPVVDGAIEADLIAFRATDKTITTHTIANKTRALVIDAKGPVHIDVPNDRARQPALRPNTVERLADLANELEKLQNTAHDVEFVVRNDEVILVQVRPAIGLGFPEGGDEKTVWSRANVGEALPGAATPLTWSVARGFSERGFQQAFRSLGCSFSPNTTLVANVHGRFYLNLTEFMRIAAQVPGMDPDTLIGLGGGQQVPQLQNQTENVSRKAFLLRLPITASRLILEQTRLDSRVMAFDQRARRRRKYRQKEKLSSLSNQNLARELRRRLGDLDETGTLMLTCASASLGSHVALEKLLSWFSVSQPGPMARTLTAGIQGLESAQPGIAIARMAAMTKEMVRSMAKGDADIEEHLMAGRYSRVEDLPSGPLKSALFQFMEEFGDRAMREAELATPRWSEEATQVLGMLKSALQHPIQPEKNALRVKSQADQAMKELEKKFSPWQVALLRKLIEHAKRTTRLREHMRAWVTRILGDIRRVALEMDHRLVTHDPEIGLGAAFFCTLDELIQAFDSEKVMRSGAPERNHLIRMRRAQYARDVGRPDPPATFVGYPHTAIIPPAAHNVLRGLAASPGVVEGKVRLLSPGRELMEGIEPGEILVARTTDIGLTPLFLLAAGVATELGGPLSHAALVAREYAVPAVVNVPGLTLALRQGEKVRIHGDLGLIERLEAQNDQTP